MNPLALAVEDDLIAYAVDSARRAARDTAGSPWRAYVATLRLELDMVFPP